MSQAVTIPNPGRELALQPPQPPTRSPGWGPRGPRSALHVPAPAAGSVLRVRQRRLKWMQQMQGAKPPSSGIGILVPNKHQLLLPQIMLGPAASFFWGLKKGRVPTFLPRHHVPFVSKGIRNTLNLGINVLIENIPDHSPSIHNLLGAPATYKKSGKEE